MPDRASKDVLDYAAVCGNKIDIIWGNGVTDCFNGDRITTTITRFGDGYITQNGTEFKASNVKKARHHNVGFSK